MPGHPTNFVELLIILRPHLHGRWRQCPYSNNDPRHDRCQLLLLLLTYETHGNWRAVIQWNPASRSWNCNTPYGHCGTWYLLLRVVWPIGDRHDYELLVLLRAAPALSGPACRTPHGPPWEKFKRWQWILKNMKLNSRPQMKERMRKPILCKSGERATLKKG